MGSNVVVPKAELGPPELQVLERLDDGAARTASRADLAGGEDRVLEICAEWGYHGVWGGRRHV